MRTSCKSKFTGVLTGFAKRLGPMLQEFFEDFACLFSLALPAQFSQPGGHSSGDSCDTRSVTCSDTPCISVDCFFRDSLNNKRFHVWKRAADKPFRTTNEQLEELRSQVEAKVLAFVPVDRNKVKITVDGKVKDAQKYYMARISFSSGETGKYRVKLFVAN